MPTYAYACRSCGHAFDAVQSFSDDALTVCPECGGELRKQYGSIGVTFNGSGFYRTDSRSGSGSSASAPASSKSEPTKSATPAPASSTASS
ncbi:FmdB family zinc ribbon protein [Microbacterium sp. LWH13-1.2]|uniref:FmdB family zinc ribbon protein n=1 Tax=Microbacterium sp. LWH13-1.2 TaxID=3135260 RepID=UPI003139F5C5